jgi:hypothetical protein
LRAKQLEPALDILRDLDWKNGVRRLLSGYVKVTLARYLQAGYIQTRETLLEEAKIVIDSCVPGQPSHEQLMFVKRLYEETVEIVKQDKALKEQGLLEWEERVIYVEVRKRDDAEGEGQENSEQTVDKVKAQGAGAGEAAGLEKAEETKES